MYPRYLCAGIALVALTIHSYTVNCEVLHHLGFGSLNISAIEKTESNNAKRRYGVICANANIRNPLAFFKTRSYFLLENRELSTELSAANYFFQPNHVGKRSAFDTAEASIVLVNQTNLTSFEICYRSVAHSGTGATIENENRIVNWLFARKGLLGLEPVQLIVSSYGCHNLTGSSGEKPFIFLSFKHAEQFLKDDVIQNHFDTVWLQQFNDSTIQACWEDVPGLAGEHFPLILQAIKLPSSQNPAADDLTVADYRVGTQQFNWPSGNGILGACVEIPFLPAFSAPPTVFATVIVKTDTLSDSYMTWIESAGETGIQACTSRTYWSKGDRTGVSSTSMNYLAVTNVVGSRQEVYLEGYAELALYFMDFNKLPTFPGIDINFITLLRNYLGEITGESPFGFEIVDVDNYPGELTIFFKVDKVTNVRAAMSKLKANLIDQIFPKNESSAEYAFYSAYMESITEGADVDLVTDTDCAFRRANYTNCNSSTCPIVGSQTVTLASSNSTSGSITCSSSKYNQVCSGPPCISGLKTSGLALSVDQRFNFVSPPGLSTVVIIIIVVAVLLVMIAGGIGGWMYMRKAKDSGHSPVMGKQLAVVLGKNSS